MLPSIVSERERGNNFLSSWPQCIRAHVCYGLSRCACDAGFTFAVIAIGLRFTNISAALLRTKEGTSVFYIWTSHSKLCTGKAQNMQHDRHSSEVKHLS